MYCRLSLAGVDGMMRKLRRCRRTEYGPIELANGRRTETGVRDRLTNERSGETSGLPDDWSSTGGPPGKDPSLDRGGDCGDISTDVMAALLSALGERYKM